MSQRFLSLICLLLTTSLLVTAGCVTKTVLIRQSMTPIPEACRGVLYVAQNKPIMVGVEGSDKLMSLDVGGYYLIHKTDLQVMVGRLKNAK